MAHVCIHVYTYTSQYSYISKPAAQSHIIVNKDILRMNELSILHKGNKT